MFIRSNTQSWICRSQIYFLKCIFVWASKLFIFPTEKINCNFLNQRNSFNEKKSGFIVACMIGFLIWQTSYTRYWKMLYMKYLPLLTSTFLQRWWRRWWRGPLWHSRWQNWTCATNKVCIFWASVFLCFQERQIVNMNFMKLIDSTFKFLILNCSEH